MIYSAGVLAAFGPWLLKNLVRTGNPVYPLMWGVSAAFAFYFAVEPLRHLFHIG